MNGTQCRVLIVEDNPADVTFLRRALREDGLVADIFVANDGDKAVEYLEHCSNEARPDLVIIDVNLPKRDGIDVLRKCRFTPSLVETKTMILTSSDDPSDHCRADLIGADAYVRKPRSFAGFAEVIAAIRHLINLRSAGQR
jgi:chemotaxis family two-component system response regulator Rcp1